MSLQPIGQVAAKIVDRWAYWREELANPGCNPRDTDRDICGYYRMRGAATKPDYPVGVYPDDDNRIVIKISRKNPVAEDSEEGWDFRCSGFMDCAAVEYEEYMAALDGGQWNDGKAARKPDSMIGHNSGDTDPFDALKIEYLGEKETAEAFMKAPIKTQAEADKVAIWADRLRKIKSKAEALHRIEKQPHLDAGRAVDDKWRDLKEEPADVVKRLQFHAKPFFDEQKRIEEERQRRAREEADRIRREAEDVAARARAASKEQTDVQREAAKQAAEEAAARAREAEREAEARKVTAGRTGARMGIRTEKVGVVTDYGKAAACLVAMKHPDMLATIDTLAKRAGKAKMPFDGMEIRDEEVVR